MQAADSCRLHIEATPREILLWPDGMQRPPRSWFEPTTGEDAASHRGLGGAGRGETLRFAGLGRDLVLRHYRRGGAVGRLLGDRYLRLGLAYSRPWRELAVLTRLFAGGMPVPEPVAARITIASSVSPWYRGDLVTTYLEGTRTLAELLRDDALDRDTWATVGATIGQFHSAGVDHADLNAHNILLDGRGGVFLIDFDRAAVRRPGAWQRRNLDRLHRSLRKLSAAGTAPGFSEGAWSRVLSGYRA